ncbi:MAG: hypothetical protein KIT58_11415 [Planctomycetota bacterium]|nr:hypothetical protein [Planctomycetota bacterium]
MLATAIVLLSLGLPFLALGIHLGRAPAEEKARRKAKKAARGPSPTSFVVGGGLLTLLGVALLVTRFSG